MKEEHKGAIEVSVIFHEGNRMMAVPKQPAPVQEPVAWANPKDLKNFDMKVRTNGGPLHTVALCLCTPPAAQRQWFGLTDEDKLDIEMMGGKSDVMLAEMVEAKLKERNA
jgi:hypothetical protein